ncbi:hypothetical protein JAAARDRAFT_81397 [Jaapia argillacea MUCL 33604]|uniref:GPI transamidase component PIG-T n=1 Tax=Jaapia argillacea MUCL 33604 TaxID=933084 RepID=A0A067PML8_9AGAM|nr:hypothetical protein JAAARDRAFT_81397 [Jaapia argillacea MUCL 33604]
MYLHWLAISYSLCLPYLILGSFAAHTEQFDEDLVLRSLRDGKVLSRFSFTTRLNGTTPRNPQSLGSEDSSQHYTLFPLALGQVLREYAVSELHLSLNAGKWNYERWGYPEESGVGTGAELWAWMGAGDPTTVDERWQGLRNALAGLFCASLGSLDEQRTTSPSLAFAPEGSLPNWTLPHLLRHASLPSEHVCTENLTPFLKLLPCKALSGIASLLNPHRLFDADWHGMSVHVLWHEDMGVEVRLAFQAVFDPIRMSLEQKRDWSLQSIFDRSIRRSCPVAASSQIRVELPRDQAYSLGPDPTEIDGEYAIFNTKNVTEELNVSLRWPFEAIFEYPLEPPTVPLTHFSVRRILTGSSQSRGQLSITIQNNLPAQIQTIYLETMPWLLEFYLHTLRVHCDGRSRDDLMSLITYTLPVPHSRPTLFEAALTLPPKATIQITMDVTKSFLRYTEHPPDAQRGWDLPPAVFVPINIPTSLNQTTSLSQDKRSGRPLELRRIYTPTLLVDLATPDFSMPYNVIIMSCTLIALTFGSIFNLLTRRFVLVRVTDSEEKQDKVD